MEDSSWVVPDALLTQSIEWDHLSSAISREALGAEGEHGGHDSSRDEFFGTDVSKRWGGIVFVFHIVTFAPSPGPSR